MLAHDSLENYYRTNAIMIKGEFGHTLTELDNLIPFEKEIYLMMIHQELEEKKQAMDDANNRRH